MGPSKKPANFLLLAVFLPLLAGGCSTELWMNLRNGTTVGISVTDKQTGGPIYIPAKQSATFGHGRAPLVIRVSDGQAYEFTGVDISFDGDEKFHRVGIFGWSVKSKTATSASPARRWRSGEPMKRRRHIWFVGSVILAVALCVWLVVFCSGPREPVYGGKKLSAWLQTIASTNIEVEQSEQARWAISQMGSNAAPYLVHGLKREALKTYWLKKADALFHSGTRFEQFNWSGGRAMIGGLRALGEPALPGLEEVMEESSNEEVLYESCMAAIFIEIRTNGSGVFTWPLSPEATARVNAVLAVRMHGVVTVRSAAAGRTGRTVSP